MGISMGMGRACNVQCTCSHAGLAACWPRINCASVHGEWGACMRSSMSSIQKLCCVARRTARAAAAMQAAWLKQMWALNEVSAEADNNVRTAKRTAKQRGSQGASKQAEGSHGSLNPCPVQSEQDLHASSVHSPLDFCSQPAAGPACFPKATPPIRACCPSTASALQLQADGMLQQQSSESSGLRAQSSERNSCNNRAPSNSQSLGCSSSLSVEAAVHATAEQQLQSSATFEQQLWYSTTAEQQPRQCGKAAAWTARATVVMSS